MSDEVIGDAVQAQLEWYQILDLFEQFLLVSAGCMVLAGISGGGAVLGIVPPMAMVMFIFVSVFCFVGGLCVMSMAWYRWRRRWADA